MQAPVIRNLNNELTRITRPESTFVEIEYGSEGCGCASLVGLPKTITFDRGQLLFTYDTTKGVLTRIVAPGADTLSYTYDGSLLTKETWSGSVNGSVQYTYDNNFRVTKQKVNATDSVIFTYDKDGLLTKAGSLSITRSTQTGLITADTLGVVTSSRTYDSFGNLATMTYKSGDTTIYDVSYTRDSLSRIASLTETIQGITKAFAYSYDTLGRLSTVKRNDTLISRYYYDANGNRDSAWTISGGTKQGTYDAQDRLLTYGGASYFYTNNGELAKKVEGADTTKYTYDHFGNLTKVVLPNGDVIDYILDGQNRRIGKKLNNSLMKRWLYEGNLRVAAELDSVGNTIARFIYGAKINVPEYVIKAGSTYRVVTDHLGSVRLIIDQSNGTIIQRIEYDEFGNVVTDTNPGFTSFGFAGGLYEQQTALIRLGVRDYDPVTGRWTAKDPSFFLGADPNLYGYSLSDPINFLDPEGLACQRSPVLEGIYQAAKWIYRIFFPKEKIDRDNSEKQWEQRRAWENYYRHYPELAPRIELELGKQQPIEFVTTSRDLTRVNVKQPSFEPFGPRKEPPRFERGR